jgi:glycosyltransferase involved in cell wall biosynthesis
MAATCPVVVTQTGGLQEIVRPHETGITVPPNHIDALAWGILHTLQHPTWARTRALNALDDLRELYSWQNVAQQQSLMYRRLQTSQYPELWSTDSCAPPEQMLV